MSFPRCPSPPPPMPSPELVPTPLPSPPPFTKKPSRRRLTLQPQIPPPIPPSLIGSPLLKKTLNHFPSHDGLHPTAQARMFGDDDDFGASRARENRRSTPLASPRTIKRSFSHHPSRCRSPPPCPAISTPPPPVPPIPAFVPPTPKHIRSSIPPSPPAEPHTRSRPLDLYLDRPVEDKSTAPSKCCDPQSGALTCVQFLAIHNPSGQCKA